MSLSWKSRPLPELLRLAGPIAASTISYSLMTLTDTLLLGHVGRSELAGVALGGLFCFVLVCFPFGLLRAGNTLVAQAVGAGRTERIGAYRGAALWSGLAMGVGVALLGQLTALLIPLFAATSAAGHAAGLYLAIRILGAPITLSYVALREVSYGSGDARSPMRATVLANLVNIGFACLFIFGLGWGVAGAALATLLANAVELATLALPLRGRFGLALARREQLSALWRLGAPTGVQFVLEVGSFAILTTMISKMSEAQMAAHTIALQAIHFGFLPVWAVGEAAAVLAGQAVGAAETAMVRRVARLGWAVSGSYAAFCAVVLGLGSSLIVAGFTADPAVVGTAIRLLHVAAVFQLFDAANVVARGTLRGTGDVRYSATVGVVTSWLFTPPLTWLLGWKLGLGALGGWLGICVEIIAGALLLVLRVERRRWVPAARVVEARAAS
jgi:MATE family multidrug resistance protein